MSTHPNIDHPSINKIVFSEMNDTYVILEFYGANLNKKIIETKESFYFIFLNFIDNFISYLKEAYTKEISNLVNEMENSLTEFKLTF